MRSIGIQEIENMALGLALLGSGGGGTPYRIKVVLQDHIKQNGSITMLDPDELGEDDFVAVLGGMGAPSVGLEKLMNGKEHENVLELAERYFNRRITAVMSAEMGGGNGLSAFHVSTRTGLPVVDADVIGRAFPELHMATFTIDGIDSRPMILSDDKGNTVIFEAIDNQWAERMSRAVTVVCGGGAFVGSFFVTAQQVQQSAVLRSATLAENLGRLIAGLKYVEGSREEAFFKGSHGHRVFKGKIVDIKHELRSGFNFGTVELEGLAEDRGRTAEIVFQNENLVALVDGQIRVTSPDLISLVDVDSFEAVNTENYRYGMRVLVVGLECYPAWRSPGGLAIVGPRAFGYDVDYVPVEELEH
jgi:DUF917 family protein